MQLFYFPYISLKDTDEIVFADLGARLWNFDKKAADYITDATLRDQIGRILATNVQGPNRLQGIGVLSIGNTDFRQLNDQEIGIAHEISQRLFLASSALNNVMSRTGATGLSLRTAENFSFVIQNFQLGNDHIAESAGFIVHQTAGGYTVDEITFQAPGYIILPMQFRLDVNMLEALATMRLKRPLVYRRILRATDLFFRSYFNDPYVDINARILLATAAFAILLDLPDGRHQREKFKEIVARYANLPREKTVSFWSERGKGSKVNEHGTRKVQWVDRFYSLRNHIVHGNVIKPRDYFFEGSQRHIDIAMIFFIFLIKARINKSLRHEQFSDRIIWDKFTDSSGAEYRGFVTDDGGLRQAISRSFRHYRALQSARI